MDLSFLSKCSRIDIVLGCVTIAKSEVESVEKIQNRVEEALKYVPVERLILAPDCGLGFLTLDLI